MNDDVKRIDISALCADIFEAMAAREGHAYCNLCAAMIQLFLLQLSARVMRLEEFGVMADTAADNIGRACTALNIDTEKMRKDAMSVLRVFQDRIRSGVKP